MLENLTNDFFTKLFIKKLENDLKQKIDELIILYDKRKLILFINSNEYNVNDKDILNKVDMLIKQKIGNIDYDLIRIEIINNKIKIFIYYKENEQLKILKL